MSYGRRSAWQRPHDAAYSSRVSAIVKRLRPQQVAGKAPFARAIVKRAAGYRRAGLSAAAGPSSPARASPERSAADQAAGRAEICPSRWRAGLPLLPRRARRRSG